MALSIEGQHLPGSSHDGTVIRIKRKRKEDALNTLGKNFFLTKLILQYENSGEMGRTL